MSDAKHTPERLTIHSYPGERTTLRVDGMRLVGTVLDRKDAIRIKADWNALAGCDPEKLAELERAAALFHDYDCACTAPRCRPCQIRFALAAFRPTKGGGEIAGQDIADTMPPKPEDGR